MRPFLRLSLLGLALASACGGGGGPGQKFCHDWAGALCGKMYACPPPGGLGPFAGASEADCAAGWTKICGDPPPAATTVSVNCSGTKHVNQAAVTLCLSDISSATCDEFNAPTYSDACDQVCVDAPGGGGGSAGGGTGGSETVGGSGGAGGSALADPVGFCRAFNLKGCDKAFECIPPPDRDATFMENFGATAQECKATKVEPPCVSFTTTCPNYSNALADACLMLFTASTCSDINTIGRPIECEFVCR